MNGMLHCHVNIRVTYGLSAETMEPAMYAKR